MSSVYLSTEQIQIPLPIVPGGRPRRATRASGPVDHEVKAGTDTFIGSPRPSLRIPCISYSEMNLLEYGQTTVQRFLETDGNSNRKHPERSTPRCPGSSGDPSGGLVRLRIPAASLIWETTVSGSR